MHDGINVSRRGFSASIQVVLVAVQKHVYSTNFLWKDGKKSMVQMMFPWFCGTQHVTFGKYLISGIHFHLQYIL